jgi:hypothetical protein
MYNVETDQTEHFWKNIFSGRSRLSLLLVSLNLRFARRTLFSSPFVTIVAIVSLALGIGANAAIFSLFNQMLLRPLSVPEPDRLASLSAPGPKPASQSCNSAGDCEVVTTLAIVQIAMSMAPLVSAGLFTKSLMNVSRVDLGLEIGDVITFRVAPELNGYNPEGSRAFFARLEDELAATPGVKAVTASLAPALSGSHWGNDVEVEGFPT